MPTVHVVTRKEELDPERLADKIVIVLDVLFATSTMTTALHHGARRIIPVATVEQARAQAQCLRSQAPLLCGEQGLQPIPDFSAFTPSAVSALGVFGRTVVYCTTNGTVALCRAAGAHGVYAGSLLNAGAVAAHVSAVHPNSTILLVCAGSAGRLCLEDFYGAGYLASALLDRAADTLRPTDATRAALALAGSVSALECLQGSSLGRRLAHTEHAQDVELASRRDVLDVVPHLEQGPEATAVHLVDVYNEASTGDSGMWEERPRGDSSHGP